MSMQETTHTVDLTDRIPVDRFGIRLAIIRADKGWNYEDAERETGIKAQNWRLWERTERSPQRYEDVCAQIARGTGHNLDWIKAGGPLQKLKFLTLHQGGKSGTSTAEQPTLPFTSGLRSV